MLCTRSEDEGLKRGSPKHVYTHTYVDFSLAVAS